MSIGTVEKIILGVGLTYFAAALTWITCALHLAYTKMDMILEHLKHCKAIMVRVPLRYGGPWGMLMLVGGISGIVTFPNFYLKRGELSLEDLKNFPVDLRRKLAILQRTLWALLFVMYGIGAIAIFDLS